MYRMVEGLVPALPFDEFLTKVKPGKRRIKATSFKDCVVDNPIIKQVVNNSKGIVPLTSTTELYRNSFFVRTVQDWNLLPESIVTAPSADAFASRVGTHTHI
jgi:hypothetical protein